MMLAYALLLILCLGLSMATASGATNETLTLAYLNCFSLGGTSFPGSRAALRVGLRSVVHQGLLPDFQIRYKFGHSKCNGRIAMQEVVKIWREAGSGLDGIIGAGCSIACQPVSLLAASWGTPAISYGCASSSLSNKGTYPTFARTAGTYTSYVLAVDAVIKLFNWTRVGILCDVVELYSLTGQALKAILERRGVDVFYHAIAPTEIDGVILPDKMEKQISVIKELKESTKVICVFMYNEDIRNALVNMWEEGMHDGKHVFIGLEVHPGYFSQTAYKPQYGAEIWQGWLLVAPADIQGQKWDNFKSDVIKALKDPDLREVAELHQGYAVEDVDTYAGLVHDAVLAWAHGVNRTVTQGHSPSDGFKVAANIFNLTFEGVTGSVVIDEKGDRRPDYKVQVVQNGHPRTILQWLAAESRLVKVYKDSEPNDWTGILWPGNGSQVPSGIPKCGWNQELCPEEERSNITVVILAVLAVVFAKGMVTAVILYYLKRVKFEKELQWAKSSLIPSEELDLTIGNNLTASRATSGSIVTSADEPRAVNAFIKKARFRGETVAVKELGPTSLNASDRLFLTELKSLRDLHHENVITFVGVSFVQNEVMLVLELAARGSLQDVLSNDSLNLTWDFKISLLTDIAAGMKHLHSTFGSHGNLTSSKCLVDGRWTGKVSGFGLRTLKENCRNFSEEHSLWTAPEILRAEGVFKADKKGDVYSFGIIMQEVVLVAEPYACNVPPLEPNEVMEKVRLGSPPYRPKVPPERCHGECLGLMAKCWAEPPEGRPSFRDILTHLQRSSGGNGVSLVDRMISKLESHTRHLEELVLARSLQIQEEQCKMERLLLELLPHSVFVSLKSGRQVAPESFDETTVFFSDLVGFTRISALSTPLQVVQMLNLVYTIFDQVSGSFNVYKVATIGDAYLVASGVPTRIAYHAAEIGNMALALVRAAKECSISHLPEECLQLRVGINSGPCVAGVVGVKMPRYLLFGETVDLASSMEAAGSSMRVHISQATADLLRMTPGFKVTQRGHTQIKGFGPKVTYWLEEVEC